MVLCAARTSASAVTAQIGADDREIMRQRRRHVSPHEMRLWEAVEKERRGARPAVPGEYRCFARGDFNRFEPVHHTRSSASAIPWPTPMHMVASASLPPVR